MAFDLSKIFGSAPQSQPSQQPVDPKQSETQGMETSQNSDPSKQESTEGSKGGDKKSESPLDEFNDLFNNDPKDGDNQGEKPNPDVYYNMDPAKLREAASRQDFTQIEGFEELATKATQGDINSLKALLNGVSQNAFVSAAQLSTDVANRTTKSGLERTKADLPEQFKSLMSQDNLSQSNEHFNHPAMQPMVSAVRQQIQTKYPNYSSKEITDMTNQYLNAVSSVFKGDDSDPTQRPNPNQAEQQKAADFSDFFK